MPRPQSLKPGVLDGKCLAVGARRLIYRHLMPSARGCNAHCTAAYPEAYFAAAKSIPSRMSPGGGVPKRQGLIGA